MFLFDFNPTSNEKIVTVQHFKFFCITWSRTNAEEYAAISQKYDTVKKTVISTLLNFGKFDLARELAEKYKVKISILIVRIQHHSIKFKNGILNWTLYSNIWYSFIQEFNVLVVLAEQMNDNERLQYYMKHFKNDGFPTFLFQWLLINGTYSTIGFVRFSCLMV